MPILESLVSDGHDYGIRFSRYLPNIKNGLPRQRSFVFDRSSPLYRTWRIAGFAIDEDPDGFWTRVAAEVPDGDCESSEQFRESLAHARIHIQPRLFVDLLRFEIVRTPDGVILSSQYHERTRQYLSSAGATWNRKLRVWDLPNEDPRMIVAGLVAELGISSEQVHIRDGLYEAAGSSKAGSAVEGPISIPKAAIDALPPMGAAETETDAQAIRRQQGRRKSKPGHDEDGEDGDQEQQTGPRHGSQASSAGKNPPRKRTPDGQSMHERALALLPVPKDRKVNRFSPESVTRAIAQYSLRPYQVVGVKHLLAYNSSLLADDMGLGKSRQAAVAARIVSGPGRILVVCPASLVFNWVDEIREIAPRDEVRIRAYDPDAKWVVCNYEKLEAIQKANPDFAVVIVDEAHGIKEPDSGRTSLVFELARNIEHRYLLTGTPLLNRYAELKTLLRFSGHSLATLPMNQFIEAITPQPGHRGMIPELANWMLRREKTDYLHDLPKKQRIIARIELPDAKKSKYDAILHDRSKTALNRIGTLRYALEIFKIEQVILPWISSMGFSDKIIVFCEYQKCVDMLLQHCQQHGIGAAAISGGVSLGKRKAALDSFQNDAACRVFVGTTGAAGVGLNITAANIVAFASLPWTAGMKNHAEDRAWRSGQLRPVEVRIPIVKDTIDDIVLEIVESKDKMSTDLLKATDACRLAMHKLGLAAGQTFAAAA